MEEKLLKEEKNTSKSEVKQPSYEDLKNYCSQLLSQRNQLAERLNEITDILNKIPWLFKVIENKDSFDKSFVSQCVEEVQIILTPPPSETETKDNNE